MEVLNWEVQQYTRSIDFVSIFHKCCKQQSHGFQSTAKGRKKRRQYMRVIHSTRIGFDQGKKAISKINSCNKTCL
jgi:hypothetical protein